MYGRCQCHPSPSNADKAAKGQTKKSKRYLARVHVTIRGKGNRRILYKPILHKCFNNLLIAIDYVHVVTEGG